MSPNVLLNRLYRYKHNNLCQALHKIIAITVLLAITNSNPCGKYVPLQTAVCNHQRQLSSNKKQKYVKINQ